MNKMKIAIGCDHHGYSYKETIIKLLESLEIAHYDVSIKDQKNVICEYPDIARLVVEKIKKNECQRGILICKTGIGMSIFANRYSYIRAGLCQNKEIVELSRKHNDINVLCLGVNEITSQDLNDIIRIFLFTDFEKGRHTNRVAKLSKL